FVAGEHQTHRVVREVVVGEQIRLVILRCQQVRENVLASVVPLGGQQPCSVFVKLSHRRQAVSTVAHAAHAIGECNDVVVVAFWDAQQCADHENGQPETHKSMEVHGLAGVSLVRGGHVVQTAVGQFLNPPVQQL